MIHSRLNFRPLSIKSTLHQNALRAGSLHSRAAAQDSVKASLVLHDFQRDHIEAAGREHEQLKLKCAAVLLSGPAVMSSLLRAPALAARANK